MYASVEDLPLCQCGCGAKARIDLEHLDQYSTAILETVIREIARITQPYEGILGCSAPTADQIAWEAWYAERDRIFDQYAQPYHTIFTELQRRQSPQTLNDALYALCRLFADHLATHPQE